MLWRYGLVVAIFAIGFKVEGLAGGTMAVVIFGFFAIMFYTACDAWATIRNEVARGRVTNEDHSQTLHVHTGESMPGEPTSREWGAIVEVARRYENNNRQRGIQNGY